MRLMRKAGLIGGQSFPTLYEFWSDATVITCSGASSSTAILRSGIPIGDTDTPVYVFASKGNSISITKFKDGGWASPIVIGNIVFQSDDYDIVVYGDNKSTIGTTVYLTTQNGLWENPDPLYGYVVAALRFPSFTEAVTDYMIKKMEQRGSAPNANAYRYNSTASTIYIADTDLSSDPNDVYLQCACSSSAGYISATRGGTPGTAIMSSGSGAFWRHYNSRYYFSSNGTSNMSTRAGGLYRLTL